MFVVDTKAMLFRSALLLKQHFDSVRRLLHRLHTIIIMATSGPRFETVANYHIRLDSFKKFVKVGKDWTA